MNLTSPTTFFGTLLNVSQTEQGVLAILEREDTNRDFVLLANDSEEVRDVLLTQLSEHCMGKRLAIIGNHVSTCKLTLGDEPDDTVTATMVELFHLAEVKRPFIEKVVEVAEELAAKKRYGCALQPITGFESMEDWFTSLATALYDIRYKEVELPGGATFDIERDDEARISYVNLPFLVPTGKCTLRAITQSPLEPNDYGERAENGTRITWFVFDYEPTNGVNKSVRAGRVEDGQMLWGETSKERLNPIFRKAVTEESAAEFVERSKGSGPTEVEFEPTSAADAVAASAAAEATGKRAS